MTFIPLYSLYVVVFFFTILAEECKDQRKKRVIATRPENLFSTFAWLLNLLFQFCLRYVFNSKWKERERRRREKAIINGVPQIIKKYDKCGHCWKIRNAQNSLAQNEWFFSLQFKVLAVLIECWKLFILFWFVAIVNGTAKCTKSEREYECTTLQNKGTSNHWILYIITAITLIECFWCFVCWVGLAVGCALAVVTILVILFQWPRNQHTHQHQRTPS